MLDIYLAPHCRAPRLAPTGRPPVLLLSIGYVLAAPGSRCPSSYPSSASWRHWLGLPATSRRAGSACARAARWGSSAGAARRSRRGRWSHSDVLLDTLYGESPMEYTGRPIRITLTSRAAQVIKPSLTSPALLGCSPLQATATSLFSLSVAVVAGSSSHGR